MLKVKPCGKFKRDFKAAGRRGWDLSELQHVIGLLQNKVPLPPKYKDHPLEDSRDYKRMRECHVSFDWLLVYYVQDGYLGLVRTGTHSDLFGE